MSELGWRGIALLLPKSAHELATRYAKQCKAMQCKAMQSNAKQSKAMQSKAMQSKAIQIFSQQSEE